jgi:ribonuclease J
VIPVHGTPRHLEANTRIARETGVGHTLLIGNGDVCALGRGPARVVGHVATGRLSPDRDGLLQPVPDETLVRMREHAA